MIILCVLLVVLTLISIIGGSIRFNEDVAKPIVIEPEPREKFEDMSFAARLGADQDKLKGILSRKKTPQYIESEAVKDEQYIPKKSSAEGFQGYEYAMFS